LIKITWRNNLLFFFWNGYYISSHKCTLLAWLW